MKYCQTCGAELHDSAEICPKCGVRCAVTQPVVSAPVQENKAVKGKVLGSVLTLALGLVGSLICQFAGDDDAKKSGWITFGIMYGLVALLIIITATS